MKTSSNKPIGVFDSGVGGLTVVRSLRKYLPYEDIVYFGDTARVPYGNKSRDTIRRFSREIIDFLIKNDVKAVIAACNTASSLAVPAVKKEFGIPVVGVIEAGVEEAVNVSKNGRIGVIGTDSTISSSAYDRELKKVRSSWKLFSKSCPLFVPLVENRFLTDDVTYMVAERYLRHFRARKIDTLILGCTHYPLLKKVISDVLEGVKLVDSATSVASTVKNILENNGLDAAKKKNAKIKCFVSDDVKGFLRIADIFLKENVTIKRAVL